MVLILIFLIFITTTTSSSSVKFRSSYFVLLSYVSALRSHLGLVNLTINYFFKYDRDSVHIFFVANVLLTYTTIGGHDDFISLFFPNVSQPKY